MRSPAWMAVLASALLLAGVAAAESPEAPPVRDLAERAVVAVERTGEDPAAAVQDPGAVIGPVVAPPEEEEGAEPAPPEEGAPGFADRVRDAFEDDVLAVGVAGSLAAALGVAGLFLVTRYVSPKEALKNPQRAMLYGYVRGHPGVHLKQLSEEFDMKTSSILWHIRKLEAAELVHSERANGFRVFYPVEGGIEIKRVSRAITALHNRNAHRIFEVVLAQPGHAVRDVAETLRMHGGTARWHLRKLRDFGLVEELVRDDGSQFFGTPLGRKALETLEGMPTVPLPRHTEGAPVPLPE